MYFHKVFSPHAVYGMLSTVSRFGFHNEFHARSLDQPAWNVSTDTKQYPNLSESDISAEYVIVLLLRFVYHVLYNFPKFPGSPVCHVEAIVPHNFTNYKSNLLYIGGDFIWLVKHCWLNSVFMQLKIITCMFIRDSTRNLKRKGGGGRYITAKPWLQNDAVLGKSCKWVQEGEQKLAVRSV